MIDKWKGFYTYEVGYPYEMRSKPFVFHLDWSINNGVIKGSCFDEACKDIFIEPAHIQGFIEGNFVSFIKKYPAYWGYDEKNNLIVVENLPAPEIHYSGNYIEKHFEGIWEMTVNIRAQSGQTYDTYCSGTWLMKRLIE
jgi:hypothetical protein